MMICLVAPKYALLESWFQYFYFPLLVCAPCQSLKLLHKNACFPIIFSWWAGLWECWGAFLCFHWLIHLPFGITPVSCKFQFNLNYHLFQPLLVWCISCSIHIHQIYIFIDLNWYLLQKISCCFQLVVLINIHTAYGIEIQLISISYNFNVLLYPINVPSWCSQLNLLFLIIALLYFSMKNFHLLNILLGITMNSLLLPRGEIAD